MDVKGCNTDYQTVVPLVIVTTKVIKITDITMNINVQIDELVIQLIQANHCENSNDLVIMVLCHTKELGV